MPDRAAALSPPDMFKCASILLFTAEHNVHVFCACL